MNKHYVGILVGNQIHYITKIDNRTHSAEWEPGKSARSMSRQTAEDVAFGLRCNGHSSVVIKLPDYERPFNPCEEDWFGIVRWHEDDIRAALMEHGFEPTEEAISLIRLKMENHCFTELQIACGWDMINEYIHDEAENLDQQEAE